MWNVDDAVLWTDSVKEAFRKICSYLTLVGRNGIVMNPAKFVFAEKTLEFAGVYDYSRQREAQPQLPRGN